MIWVAIEDVDMHEISEFEEATRDHVLYLLDGYKTDLINPTKFHTRDGDIIYEGVTYQGGFGYNVVVARKYFEV